MIWARRARGNSHSYCTTATSPAQTTRETLRAGSVIGPLALRFCTTAARSS